MSRSLLIPIVAVLVLVGAFALLARTDSTTRPGIANSSGEHKPAIVLFCAP